MSTRSKLVYNLALGSFIALIVIPIPLILLRVKNYMNKAEKNLPHRTIQDLPTPARRAACEAFRHFAETNLLEDKIDNTPASPEYDIPTNVPSIPRMVTIEAIRFLSLLTFQK